MIFSWFCKRQAPVTQTQVVKQVCQDYTRWVVRRTDVDGKERFLGSSYPEDYYWWTAPEHVQSYAIFKSENAAITAFEQLQKREGPFLEEIVREQP